MIERSQHIQSAFAFTQAQVGNHDVRRQRPSIGGFHGLCTVLCHGHFAAPALQQVTDAGQDRRFVIDHQHAHARNIQWRLFGSLVEDLLRRHHGQQEAEYAAAART